jgi:hypothetical protein
MLHPQIIVHERDSRLAALSKDLAAAERWALREPRQSESLWKFLRQSCPTVFVLAIARNPDAELRLIQEVAWKCPHVAVVAVGSVDDAETLAGLCWDLGADYALFPPLSRDLLPDVVRGLMQRAIKKESPPAAADGLIHGR